MAAVSADGEGQPAAADLEHPVTVTRGEHVALAAVHMPLAVDVANSFGVDDDSGEQAGTVVRDGRADDGDGCRCAAGVDQRLEPAVVGCKRQIGVAVDKVELVARQREFSEEDDGCSTGRRLADEACVRGDVGLHVAGNAGLLDDGDPYRCAHTTMLEVRHVRIGGISSGYARTMSDSEQDPNRTPEGDRAEHATGGLDHAPTTPTDEKSEPEAGTGSADKRSEESLAEQDEPPSDASNQPGEAGGDITR